MNLIQYKDKPAINLYHVRWIHLFVGMQSQAPRSIEFAFSDGSEVSWFFEDPVEAVEVYKKIQSKFIQHV